MFHCATSNARCEAPDFPHAESADQWGQFLSDVFRISVPPIQSGREVILKYIVPATEAKMYFGRNENLLVVAVLSVQCFIDK